MVMKKISDTISTEKISEFLLNLRELPLIQIKGATADLG